MVSPTTASIRYLHSETVVMSHKCNMKLSESGILVASFTYNFYPVNNKIEGQTVKGQGDTSPP
jgi:hypothetical protein